MSIHTARGLLALGFGALSIAAAAAADLTPTQKFFAGATKYREPCFAQGFAAGTPGYYRCVVMMYDLHHPEPVPTQPTAKQDAPADRTREQRYLDGEAEFREGCMAQGFARATHAYERCIVRKVDEQARVRAFAIARDAEAADHAEPAAAADPPPREVDPNSLEGRLTRAYGERCGLAGYQPGTGAFGQCLLTYNDRDEQTRQAMLGQLLLNQLNQPAPQPQRAVLPSIGQRTCTSIINNNIVTTNCR